MSTTMEAINVKLTADQIGDLVFQQMEDEYGEDTDAVHPRHAIDFTIKALDNLGLIVRAA